MRNAWNEIVEYRDGEIYWKISHHWRMVIGNIAGDRLQDGRRRLRYRGRQYYVHRIIWEMFNGEIPDNLLVDHIDCDNNNNLISNLRIATKLENNRNTGSRKGSSSKYKGVSWDKKREKWCAKIQVLDIYKHLGYFGIEEDAAVAYNKFATLIHDDFVKVNNV